MACKQNGAISVLFTMHSHSQSLRHWLQRVMTHELDLTKIDRLNSGDLPQCLFAKSVGEFAPFCSSEFDVKQLILTILVKIEKHSVRKVLGDQR